MIGSFITALQRGRLLLSNKEMAESSDVQSLLDDEDIADALWLASKIGGAYQIVKPTEETPPIEQTVVIEDIGSAVLPNLQPFVSAYMPESLEQGAEVEETSEKNLPIQVDSAPSLSDTRSLGRSLRPLMRKAPSRIRSVLDEVATVDHIARHNIWWPILKPTPERWFDLELVIEDTPFSFIWHKTLDEFRHLLESQGSFRSVRTWYVEDKRGEPRLTNKRQTSLQAFPSRQPRELIDASSRRIVLFISDCRSQLWKEGKIYDWLTLWAKHGPMAVVQLLPERLWPESELDVGYAVQVGAYQPGAPNTKLQVKELPIRNQIEINTLILPIVTLTAGALKQWALVVAAAGRQRSPGRLFDLSWVKDPERSVPPGVIQPKTPEARVELFMATASGLAQRLARMMAAVPVELPVVHLIQQEILKDVQPIHIAEVYNSSLLEPIKNTQSNSDEFVRYDFAQGVRRLLNERTPIDETIDVIEILSRKIAKSLPRLKITNFTALLVPDPTWDEETQEAILPFAQITTTVLHNLGGDYAELAQLVEAKAKVRSESTPLSEVDAEEESSLGDFPSLEDFEFQTAQFVDSEDAPIFPPVLQTKQFTIATITIETNALQLFNFTVATIQKNSKQPIQWIIQRNQDCAYRFIETLSDGLRLEMVAIPGGNFLMGSPEDEPERLDTESPLHGVTVSPFLIGRYPVTQAQWKAVAEMPQVKRELNADPSSFKGNNLPVMFVSWHMAIEFCARLTKYTNRHYRLPSEAEWEYACRAGTTTPFHFGETITTELANYQDRGFYNAAPKGKDRIGITSVGRFGISNAFGLSDMHGNIQEWCADHWHRDYEGAPADGSPWLDITNSKVNQGYIFRGGSWLNNPRDCRSASRHSHAPNFRSSSMGFRVCCASLKFS
jgi:formylglycine-generating enzyme required for sulfatase activity